MKIKLEMRCDNAAFGLPDSCEFGLEVARILREAADKFENGHASFSLRDINGNRVGDAYLATEG